MLELFSRLNTPVKVFVITFFVIILLIILNYDPEAVQKPPQPSSTQEEAVVEEEPVADKAEAEQAAPAQPALPEPSLQATQPEPPAAVVPSAPVGVYTIQVASSQDMAPANDIAQKLTQEGYAAQVVDQDMGANGVWHRIYVGGFNTPEEGQKTLESLKAKFHGAFLKKR